MKKIKNYISGAETGNSNNFLSVEDPSTGEQIAEVILSTIEDFDQTIISSKNAFDIWSKESLSR